MLTQEEKDEAVGRAIQAAAGKLPEGWEMRICIERDSGVVELYNDDGFGVEFPSNCESLADQITDAMDYAIESSLPDPGT